MEKRTDATETVTETPIQYKRYSLISEHQMHLQLLYFFTLTNQWCKGKNYEFDENTKKASNENARIPLGADGSCVEPNELIE